MQVWCTTQTKLANPSKGKMQCEKENAVRDLYKVSMFNRKTRETIAAAIAATTTTTISKADEYQFQ